MGVLCFSFFSNASLCVHSSFEIILKRKRKQVALLLLSYRCSDTINVSMALPNGAVGWYAVCDCGIS